MRNGILFTAALAAVWPAVASSQAPLDANAVLFGSRESATGLHLSPSGNLVTYIAPRAGGGSVAFVADLGTEQPTAVLSSGKGADRLRWCNFVTEKRIVCRYTGTIADPSGLLIGFGRLVAINTDGTGMKELGQRASNYDLGLRQYDGQVIDWLPGGGGSVLMARSYVPEDRSDTRMVRTAEGVGVDRLDTATLKVTSVESAKLMADGFWSDGQGNVRLMSMAGAVGQMLTGKDKYWYRTKGSHDWLSLTDYVRTEDFEPAAVDGEVDALYALKPLNGRKALYRIRLTSPTSEELIASNPTVDIDNVVRSADGQRVIGYTYATDKRQVEYFDPEYHKLRLSLGNAIPNLPIIDFQDASADGNRVLVRAASDNDPGRYYVFDKKTRTLAEILLVRPGLENFKLAQVKPVAVKAPDGTAIPAYLTLPGGKEAEGLAAVVLPHGGPSSRDEWGFDWLAQYLASKGYAVLQPNYRGSAGFGDAWLMQNGFKSWRTSIGDITASAQWLVAQGIADRNRLAIFGWSYGGYAALQSAAIEPSLFKAAIAVAPVTDLGMLKDEAKDYTSAEVVEEFIGTGQHIIDGSPLKHAASIKAPVLLAHGDLDTNVRVAESDKMEAALRSSGAQVEYLRFKGLDHQLEDSDARSQLLTKIGQLLERTIGH